MLAPVLFVLFLNILIGVLAYVDPFEFSPTLMKHISFFQTIIRFPKKCKKSSD